MLDDIANLWKLRDDKYAVMCVQHDHRPKEATKFLGEKQLPYPRKNWSSLMLMNGEKCRALTPDHVARAPGLDLHQFKWAQDAEIGALPPRWNHLVDHDPALPLTDISLLHYTIGGPYLKDYRECGYADVWREECARMTYSTG
jgi:hypothetical protein